MAAITSGQNRRIHAIARSLGITDEVLHDLVYDLTQKTSIRELQYSEACRAIGDLEARQVIPHRRGGSSVHSAQPGRASEAQQRKVWAMMYKLEAASPSNTPVGDRLCGVIRKELKLSAFPQNPFAFLDFEKCSHLIDVLKRYVRNAEKQAQKAAVKGDAGDG